MKHHLKRHLKVHETDGKPEECRICGARFAKKAQLRTHVTMVHRDNTSEREYVMSCKPHVCTYEGCDRSFTTEGKLRKHLALHAERKHVCGHQDCGAAFGYKKDLQHHLMVVHKRPKNRHAAAAAEASQQSDDEEEEADFLEDDDDDDDEEDDATHQRLAGDAAASDTDDVEDDVVDDDQEQYVCERCGGKQFKNRASLQYHVRRFHAPGVSAPAAGTTSKAEATVYACPHDGCMRTYSTMGNLNIHIRKAHTMEDMGKWRCTLCCPAATFAYKHTFQRHLKNTHKKGDAFIRQETARIESEYGVSPSTPSSAGPSPALFGAAPASSTSTAPPTPPSEPPRHTAGSAGVAPLKRPRDEVDLADNPAETTSFESSSDDDGTEPGEADGAPERPVKRRKHHDSAQNILATLLGNHNSSLATIPVRYRGASGNGNGSSGHG